MIKRPKTGGRRKGTPNVLTMQSRSALVEAIAGEIQQIPAYLEAVGEEKRLEFLIKLLPFVLPRIEPMDAEKADRLGLLPYEAQVRAFDEVNSLDPFIRSYSK